MDNENNLMARASKKYGVSYSIVKEDNVFKVTMNNGSNYINRTFKENSIDQAEKKVIEFIESGIAFINS